MNTSVISEIRENTSIRNIADRVDTLDWERLWAELDAQGCAVIEKLITPEECDALAGLYQKEGIFRSRVVMARHGFGRGEYKYFSYPLPDIVDELRDRDISTAGSDCQSLECRRWALTCAIRRNTLISSSAATRRGSFGRRRCCCNMSRGLQLPASGFVRRACVSDSVHHSAFRAGRDFTGGEFVLTEQRPRMQSRPEVVPLRQGDAVAVCRASSAGAGQCGEYIGSICGTASAASARAIVIPQGLFFMMQPKAGCEPGCRRREDLLEVCMRAEKG